MGVPKTYRIRRVKKWWQKNKRLNESFCLRLLTPDYYIFAKSFQLIWRYVPADEIYMRDLNTGY